MTEQIFNGDHYANTYNGVGSGLTSIPRSGLLAGSANHVIVNDGSGNLSSVALLNTARGGLGVDSTAFTGVGKVSGGVWSAAAILNADVSASAAISRSKLASGGASTVIINDPSGVMSEEAQLSTARGGTGQNFSGVGVGPFVLSVSSGVMSATTGISTSATPNTLALRDGSGNLTGATINATTLSTSTITAPGDLSIQPAGGDVLLATNILHLTPNGLAGGDTTFRVGNGQTIGTNTITLVTIPTTSGTAYGLSVLIVAADNTGGTAAGQFTFIVRAKNIGGVVTLGTVLNKSSSRDAPITTASVGVAVSGTSILVQVTGAAGVTLNWCAEVTVVQQAF